MDEQFRDHQNCTSTLPLLPSNDLRASSCCNIPPMSARPRPRPARGNTSAQGPARWQHRPRTPPLPVLPMLPHGKTLEPRLAETDGRTRTDGPARRFRRSGVSLRVMRVNVTERRGIDRVQGFHSFVLQSRCGSGFIFAALSFNLLLRAHTLTSQNHKLNIRFAVQVARSSIN